MRQGTRHLAAAAVGAAVMAVVIPVAPASAAACSGQVRYAKSTNTVYLNSGQLSLSDLPRVCPGVPLTEVDPRSRTWQLNANLVVQNGSVLRIHGSRAAKPGGVDTLRLSSPADSRVQNVVSITAQYGTISIDSTKVTSWDPASGGPDTDPGPPPGAGPDAKARAFIRAVSFLDPATGVPRQSRMDIANSDLGYLGWHSAESYGVAYKARGCDAAHPAVCAKLRVFGSQRNSRFHHNYMGTYTFGARDMVFDRNEYAHNTTYGLDPHDDSDYLTITGNHFHHNGNHGLICSKRCDHLRIADNESNHNGTARLSAGAAAGEDRLVHGIMIHVGVTDSVIENNRVHDHPNGAGISVFDSVRNVIRNNTVTNNKFGIRISVGSHGLTFRGNTITGSGSYHVYSTPGGDPVTYGMKSGRPTGNLFAQNSFGRAGVALAYLDRSDRTRFADNKVLGGQGTIRLKDAQGTVWQGRRLPADGLQTVPAA